MYGFQKKEEEGKEEMVKIDFKNLEIYVEAAKISDEMTAVQIECVKKLIEIADKYGKDRNMILQISAKTFSDMAKEDHSNF